MPSIAVIKDGKVVNTIASTLEFAQTLGFDQVVDVTNLGVGIGWGYLDGEFIAPPPPEITVPNT
jgi:hypothetical protein